MYMFELSEFGAMINDRVRMNAYHEALRRTVHDDSVVIDIGAGTGIFSLMACQLGAKRVYAIDPNSWIDLGKQMAAANGFANRIVFIRDVSTNVTLPERADIIVSELRGRQPIVPHNIPTIEDARRRLLKPDGLLIPERDVVYAAFISAAERYENSVIEPWLENPYQLDLSAAAHFIQNTLQIRQKIDVEELILPGQVWVDIDYRTREDPNVSARLEWIASKAGTAHYLVIWFDTYLHEDVGFSTAPGKETASLYKYNVLPLEHPLQIEPDDQITLDLKATLAHGKYVFSWNTVQRSNAGLGSVKASYRQSTFFSSMLPDMRSQLSSKPDEKSL